jgi:hypothetical protein
MKKQSATPTQAALMKRPTPTQAAQAAHAKFGILVIPVDTEPLAGDVTCSYGQAPTRMLFRYIRPSTSEEWAEHADFLRSIGVGVPEALKDWRVWAMEVVDDPQRLPDLVLRKLCALPAKKRKKVPNA